MTVASSLTLHNSNKKDIAQSLKYMSIINQISGVEKFLDDYGFLTLGRDYILCKNYSFSLQRIITSAELTMGSIMSFKLTLGKTAITVKPTCTNEAIMAFVPNGNYPVHPSYFYHFFGGRDWTKGTNRAVMGATLNKATLSEIDVPIPPLSKQIEIAEHLDKVDALIFFHQQQLSKLENLVKSRFIELFGDPDTNPFGWNEDVLSAHLDVIGGYAFKSDKFEDDGIPVLRIGNINSGRFLPVNMVYWNDDPALDRYKMYPGDLVMSLTGTVGKDDYGNVCILGADYPVYYLNQRNAKLSLKTTLNARYLSELLKFERIKRRLTGISRGVRQANISNKDILCLCVPIAPIELQEQFAAFVEQIDKSKFECLLYLKRLRSFYILMY